MNFQQAVEELYHWQRNPGADNFHALLYTLIAKSDLGNRARLELAFPEEVDAYRKWFLSVDPDDFFESHGILR